MNNDQFLRIQNRKFPRKNDQHGESKIFNNRFISKHKKVWRKKANVKIDFISHMSKSG